jgi:peptidoglycan hydrolase-like protein with peptidoglycan-binding domain
VASASFRPEIGLWGDWPTTLKPIVGAFATGDAVRYLQGVLVLRAGQTSVTVNGVFDGATVEAVKALQAFTGLTPTGTVEAATWGVIDLLASAP